MGIAFLTDTIARDDANFIAETTAMRWRREEKLASLRKQPNFVEELGFIDDDYNTGNALFIEAIGRMLDVDFLSQPSLDALGAYDSFVTTDLVWVTEGMETPERIRALLNVAGEKPVIPLSIGLQTADYKSDFLVSPAFARDLQRLNERCSFAVRGSYTAEILFKNGVKDITILGCPSVYAIPLYQDSLRSLSEPVDQPRTIANYNTFWGQLRQRDLEFLMFASRTCETFIEQTHFKLDSMDGDTDTSGLSHWLDENTRIFTNVGAWVHHNKSFDFSIGARFHANIAALSAGVRSLFLISDSRTREMVNFFSFPSMELDGFKSTIALQDYFGLADYAAFRARYRGLHTMFDTFLDRNNLPIFQEFADRRRAFDFS